MNWDSLREPDGGIVVDGSLDVTQPTEAATDATVVDAERQRQRRDGVRDRARHQRSSSRRNAGTLRRVRRASQRRVVRRKLVQLGPPVFERERKRAVATLDRTSRRHDRRARLRAARRLRVSSAGRCGRHRSHQHRLERLARERRRRRRALRSGRRVRRRRCVPNAHDANASRSIRPADAGSARRRAESADCKNRSRAHPTAKTRTRTRPISKLPHRRLAIRISFIFVARCPP